MTPKRRRRVILFAFAATLTTITTLMLKSYIVDQGRLLLEKFLSSEIEGWVSIEEMELSMIRSDLHIRNVRVQSQQYGIHDLTVEKATISVAPFPIFFGKLILSKISVDGLNLDAVYPAPAWNNKKEEVALKRIGPEPKPLVSIVVEQTQINGADLQVQDANHQWQAKLRIVELLNRYSNRNTQTLSLKGNGEGEIALANGDIFDIPLRSIQTKIAYQTQTKPIIAAIEEMIINTDAINIHADGSVYPLLALNIENEVALQHPDLVSVLKKLGLDSLPEPLPLSGILKVKSNLQGSLRNPTIYSELSSPAIGFLKEAGKPTSNVTQTDTQTNVTNSSSWLVLRNLRSSARVSSNRFELLGLSSELENGSFETKGFWNTKSNQIQLRAVFNRIPVVPIVNNIVSSISSPDSTSNTKRPLIDTLLSGQLDIDGQVDSALASFRADIRPNLLFPDLAINLTESPLRINETSVTGLIRVSADSRDKQKSSATNDQSNKQNGFTLKVDDTAINLVSDVMDMSVTSGGLYGPGQTSLNGAFAGKIHQKLFDGHPIFEKVSGGTVAIEGNYKLGNTPKEAQVQLSMASEQIGLNDRPYSLRTTAVLNNQVLQVSELSLNGSDGEHLHLSATYSLDEENLIAAHAQAKDLEVRTIGQIATNHQSGQNRPNQESILDSLEGKASLDLTCSGRLDSLSGNYNLKLDAGKIEKLTYKQITASGHFIESKYQVDQLSLLAEQGRIDAKAQWDQEKNSIRATFASEGLRTSSFYPPLQEYVPEDRNLSIKGTIEGTLPNPTIDTSVVISSDSNAPIILASISEEISKPRLTISLPGNPSTVEAKIGENLKPEQFATKPLTASIAFSLRDLNIVDFGRRLGHSFDRKLSTTLSGSGNFEIFSDETYEGQFELSNINVIRDSKPYVTNTSVAMNLNGDGLFLRDCMVTGLDTRLICDSDSRIKGQVDLELLRLFLDFVPRSGGLAYLDLRSIGSLDDFNFEGDLKVENAAITFEYFWTLIENLNLEAKIRPNQIQVESLSARAGSGTVLADGTIGIQKWSDFSFDVDAALKSVPARVFRDLPSTVTGNVSLKGPDTNTLLKGQFDLERMRYTKRFDWRSKLFNFSRSQEANSADIIRRRRNRGITFDLAFQSREPVIVIENNLGNIRARGDFKVVGPSNNLGLLGTFDVASGEIEFQNHAFEIDHGTLTFDDPDVLTPNVDIYATSRIEEYTVTANVRTEDFEVVVDLTSSPPLNETDLLTLITVGSLNNTGIATGGQSGNVTENVAVGIVSGTLQDKVEKIGIFDSFRVVPTNSDSDDTNRLRLVLGKELTKNLDITYSTDFYNVGTDQEVNLEQNLDQNLSILGRIKNSEPNEAVDLGVDVEISVDF